MTSQQKSSTGTQGTTASQGSTGRSSAIPGQGPSGSQTGVRDATYNLISVVYHALQGAETYKMYEEDVEGTQDEELAQFFRQACEEEKRRAQQGKELLARHLQGHSGGYGGQQLQQGRGRQEGAGGSRAGQQMQSGSKDQAGPGDQYGNSQSPSARR